MTFRPGYAAATLALLLTETAIALWVRDRIVRPVGGDVLAVLLVYCGLRAVTPLRVVPAAVLATAVGFVVEAGQALHLIDHAGLGTNRWARTIFGTAFSITDLFAYALGGTLAVVVERLRLAAR